MCMESSHCEVHVALVCFTGGSSSTIRRCVLQRNLPKTWDTSTSTGGWLNETEERCTTGDSGGCGPP